MKKNLHPEYQKQVFVCSCGNRIEVGTAFNQKMKDGEIHIGVCSACHPFYTGKQRKAAAGGRREKFERKLNRS